MQKSLFDTIQKNSITELDGGSFLYIKDFLGIGEAEDLMNLLNQEIHWKQESMRMYGKTVQFPRLTAWYGDAGKSYTYSGKTYLPEPWHPALLSVKAVIETTTNHRFNSVLLNLYRAGNDSMGWHADDEPELGKDPIIASLSLGASRVFQLRHNLTRQRLDIELAPGSLFVMMGSMQHHWQHQIPKTKRKVGPRMNLTFREIKA